MMHKTRQWTSQFDSLLQRLNGQTCREGAIQLPAHHLARKAVQNYGQIDELCQQPNVGDVGHPQLINPA